MKIANQLKNAQILQIKKSCAPRLVLLCLYKKNGTKHRAPVNPVGFLYPTCSGCEPVTDGGPSRLLQAGRGGGGTGFFPFYHSPFLHKDLTTIHSSAETTICSSAEISKSGVFLRIELKNAELPLPSTAPSTSSTGLGRGVI